MVSLLSPARRRWARFAARVFGLALSGLIAAALPAWAHGALRRSEPAQGAHLQAVPRQLRLVFTEAVELPFARVSLSGPGGAVALGAPALAPDSATVLVVPVQGGMTAGMYQISWQVAGEDGHPVRGQIAFMVAPGAQGIAAPAGPAAGAGMPHGPTGAPMDHGPPGHHDPATFGTGQGGLDAESPLYVAVRWITFLGLLGVIGAVAFRLVLWGIRRERHAFEDALVPDAARRAAKVGLVMTGVVAAAALLRLLAQSYALGVGAGALLGTLTRTMWGWGWLLQIGGTLAALAGFLWAARRDVAPPRVAPSASALPTTSALEVTPPVTIITAPPIASEAERPAGAAPDAGGGDEGPPLQPSEDRRLPVAAAAPGTDTPASSAPETAGTPGWWLAGLGALALAATPALSGHAAATTTLAPLPIIADTLHVVGAGGWLGSLLLLLLVGLPVALGLRLTDRGPAVAALVNAFSPTALFFAGTAAATGVFSAWLHLGNVPALWESGYGRTLLLKLGVLSVVFGTGAYNWLKVKPSLGEESAAGRLRRSATVELAVGAVVLLVTAVLVATATPTGAEMMMEGDMPMEGPR